MVQDGLTPAADRVSSKSEVKQNEQDNNTERRIHGSRLFLCERDGRVGAEVSVKITCEKHNTS